MIRKLLKFILNLAGAVIICGALVWILAALDLGTVSDAARDVKNAVLKYVDPVAVVEGGITDTLDKAADDGVLSPEDEQVIATLRNLDLKDLEVMTLPDDAVEVKTLGSNVTVTFYQSPDYLTIGYRGAQITVAV